MFLICSDSVDGMVIVVINDGIVFFIYDWSDDVYDGMDIVIGLSVG